MKMQRNPTNYLWHWQYWRAKSTYWVWIRRMTTLKHSNPHPLDKCTGSPAGRCQCHFQWALFGLTLQCIVIHRRSQITSSVRGYHGTNQSCGPLEWGPLTDRLEISISLNNPSSTEINTGVTEKAPHSCSSFLSWPWGTHIHSQKWHAQVLASDLINWPVWWVWALFVICCRVKTLSC